MKPNEEPPTIPVLNYREPNSEKPISAKPLIVTVSILTILAVVTVLVFLLWWIDTYE